MDVYFTKSAQLRWHIESLSQIGQKVLMNVTHGLTLSFEEYGIMFTRIEAVFNSCPICHKHAPTQGSAALTLAHFLISRHMTSISHIDDEKISRTNRLQLIWNQLCGF